MHDVPGCILIIRHFVLICFLNNKYAALQDRIETLITT